MKERREPSSYYYRSRNRFESITHEQKQKYYEVVMLGVKILGTEKRAINKGEFKGA